MMRYNKRNVNILQRKGNVPGSDDFQHWRSSPKRLVKQGAIDSLPPLLHEEGEGPRSAFYRKVPGDRRHSGIPAPTLLLLFFFISLMRCLVRAMYFKYFFFAKCYLRAFKINEKEGNYKISKASRGKF